MASAATTARTINQRGTSGTSGGGGFGERTCLGRSGFDRNPDRIMDNNRPKITVFCGSSHGSDAAYARDARRFGALIAERGYDMVFGGGNIGLMGEVAHAAREGGARVIGVLPNFLHKTVPVFSDAAEIVVTDSMHERKAAMYALAQAFVALPGGIGTLEETVEVLTWAQLELHAKPIVIVNTGGCWSALIEALKTMIHNGFAHPSLLRMVTVVDDPDAAIRVLDDSLSKSILG